MVKATVFELKRVLFFQVILSALIVLLSLPAKDSAWAETTFTITTTTGPNGKITPGTITANNGTNRTFTLKPNKGYHLAEVKVDGLAIFDGTTISDPNLRKVRKSKVYKYSFRNITSDHSIEASFAIDTFNLQVSKSGTGSGIVTSSLSGINCGAECGAVYDYNTIVTLEAKADEGSIFAGWSGSCKGKKTTCSLRMTKNASIKANFVKAYTLRVAKEGDGKGIVRGKPKGIDKAIICGSDCTEDSATYLLKNPDKPRNVKLTAMAMPDSRFKGWSGACTVDPCIVTMDSDKSVTAMFTAEADIQSYEAYTDSNGIASFALSDGSVDKIRIADSDTGEPIEGIKVILTTDGVEALYLVMDEDNEYAPMIQSYKLETAETAIKPAFVFFTAKEEVLSKWSKLKNWWEGTQPPIVTPDRLINPDLIFYFNEKKAEYHRTTTVGGVSDVILNTLLIIADGAAGTFATAVLAPTGVGAVAMGAFTATLTGLSGAETISYAFWESQLKAHGYKDDDVVDIYKVGDIGVGSILIIVVPRKPLPTLSLSSGTIYGKILDHQGNPIPDAKIYIQPLPIDGLSRTSSAIGNFGASVAFNANPYSLRVVKDGYADGYESVTINSSTGSAPLSIILIPKASKGSIKLTVKDSVTQNPLSNATVIVSDSSNNSFFPAQTDSNGIYLFEEKPDTYRLLISKAGYITQEINVDVQAGVTTARTISLIPSPTILSDLTISASLSSNYTAAQSINIPVTVSRSGGNLTLNKNVEVGLYWSADNMWSSSDTNLWYDNANYTIGSLNTNGSKTINAAITIPSVSTSGTYYLIMVTDKNNYHMESNELNNIAIYPVNVYAQANVPPNSASNLKATALSSDRIALYWSDNSHNETGFRIERRIGTTGNFLPLTTVGNSVAYYEDSGLAPNTQHFYRVRAYNGYGDSASYSNEAFATTHASTTLPTATTNSATNITSNSATLNGYINPNAVNTGFFFQYGTNSGTYGNLTMSQIIGTTAGNYSANVTGLSPNTTYYFRIVAVAARGTVFGSQMSFTTSSGSSPIAFTSLTPSTISTSTAPYDATLSASGTNFNNVNRVTFTWSGAVSGNATWDKGDSNWNNKVTVNSNISMTLRPRVVETSPTWSGTVYWTVTLRDTTGATASKTFTVTYTMPVAQSDLVIQNLSVNPTGGLAGSNATVSFTIKNQGSGTANASTTNIRINTSSGNVTTSDPLLASISTPSIAAGGTYYVSQPVTIPSNRPSGTNYIWAILDVNSTANQSNETNDKAYTPFTVTAISTPVERITNGSFSSGTSGWTLGLDFWAGIDGVYPRTSPGYAAGGVNSSGYPKDSATGWMYQAVTIPANATTATLSFWYYITTQETGSTGNDFLNATIQNSSGTYLATVAFLSNLNKGTGYSQITFNMLPYKGQTVRINFLATTNSSLNTVFRIDDVSLMADGN